ncbi:MAG: hypothetical protein WD270_07065 [Acetobacterales bacterium]
MTVLSIVGLFIASGAADPTMYWVGLLWFAFGIMFVFLLIHRHTGGPSGDRRAA